MTLICFNLFSTEDDNMKWMDGSPVDFTHWDDGVVPPVKDTREPMCVFMSGYSGRWRLSRCRTRRGHICQTKAGTVLYLSASMFSHVFLSLSHTHTHTHTHTQTHTHTHRHTQSLFLEEIWNLPSLIELNVSLINKKKKY